jgi:hypothetical protein
MVLYINIHDQDKVPTRTGTNTYIAPVAGDN